MNTHRRKNDTSLYPILPTLVVTTHLSISRRYFPRGWCGRWHSEGARRVGAWCISRSFFTKRSSLTIQTIHCWNGSWWMVVSLQRPSLLTYLLTKFSRYSSVNSSKNVRWTHRPTQILATRWLHLVNCLYSGLSRCGPKFQNNLFGNRGKSVDTSQQRIWVTRTRRQVSQLSIVPRNS